MDALFYNLDPTISTDIYIAKLKEKGVYYKLKMFKNDSGEDVPEYIVHFEDAIKIFDCFEEDIILEHKNCGLWDMPAIAVNDWYVD